MYWSSKKLVCLKKRASELGRSSASTQHFSHHHKFHPKKYSVYLFNNSLFRVSAESKYWRFPFCFGFREVSKKVNYANLDFKKVFRYQSKLFPEMKIDFDSVPENPVFSSFEKEIKCHENLTRDETSNISFCFILRDRSSNNVSKTSLTVAQQKDNLHPKTSSFAGSILY